MLPGKVNPCPNTRDRICGTQISCYRSGSPVAGASPVASDRAFPFPGSNCRPNTRRAAGSCSPRVAAASPVELRGGELRKQSVRAGREPSRIPWRRIGARRSAQFPTRQRAVAAHMAAGRSGRASRCRGRRGAPAAPGRRVPAHLAAPRGPWRPSGLGYHPPPLPAGRAGGADARTHRARARSTCGPADGASAAGPVPGRPAPGRVPGALREAVPGRAAPLSGRVGCPRPAPAGGPDRPAAGGFPLRRALPPPRWPRPGRR